MSVSAKRRPSLIRRLSGYYCYFKHYAARLDSPFLLLVRLYWGWQFAQSGWGRLHNSHAVEFFASLGIPAPGIVEPAVSCLELFGGILLIVGLASRLTGFLLACDMAVAYLTSDRDALRSIFSDPGKFYNADPFTFLFASLIVLIFGAGFFSLDYFFSHRKR
ncbi:DoxX family protein [Alloacidobacterium dinghuense]|uniref:DoxX family protein n=1 Tax=Alloacidobacterium dinghuense TaxID=2763107 RepID=A0A7G8BMX0_9BACT|nr:DoxX family protein [Alloacidobacterium dinghuense]